MGYVAARRCGSGLPEPARQSYIPAMKIFWSWQSDTHQPSGRHFVRGVLADLAHDLNDVDETEDAERPEGDADEEDKDGDLLAHDGRIEVDQDTHGVDRSPPIAETILRKIREAAVFVADVTPTCTTSKGKRVPNPNVMIELGYAMKVPRARTHCAGHELGRGCEPQASAVRPTPLARARRLQAPEGRG